MPPFKKFCFSLCIALSGLLYITLGYFTPRPEFTYLLAQFVVLFSCYGAIYNWADAAHQWSWKVAIISACLFRILLLPAIPELSDDFYRFIWDGRLLANGFDPFAHLPRYYIQSAGSDVNIPGINEALYQNLNSQEYYTIYPPLCQGIFGLSAWIFPESIRGSVMIIRLFMLAFEAGTIFFMYKLLKAFGQPLKPLLLYALNPLVIIELTGNLHFEGAMIFFLILALWFAFRRRWISSALAFTGSVLAKLLPLMLIPALIKRLGWSNTALYTFGVLIFTGGSFLWILDIDTLNNLANSIELYFQTFEFNASVYYILRWLGFQWQGYNMIATMGTILPIITLLSILLLAWIEKNPAWQNLPERFLFILTIYLALSTTVHPWYVTPLIAFSCFTHFRFPIVWSFLVILSYATYQDPSYTENFWLIAFEYLVLFSYLGWELKRSNNNLISR